jgi:ribonuclease HI
METNKQKKLIIYTDGGARGNPGPAGIGCVIYDADKNIVAKVSEYIGETTNNQAEYRAVIAALEKIRSFAPEELEFFLDSELVVKQLNREYKVKNKELAPLFVKIYNECMKYKKTSFKHIRRELNSAADALANEAMDKRQLTIDN